MGDVIHFPQPQPAELHPLARRAIERMLHAEDREARRRVCVYAAGKVTASLLRILALYPWMRLTHAKRARRCVECGALIQPGELHFVFQGSYMCQSGMCVNRSNPA